MVVTVVARLLGGVGLLAVALTALLAWLAPEAPGLRYLAAAAGVGLAGWLYLDWDALRGHLRSRGGVEGITSWAIVAACAVAAGLALHITAQDPRRWDLSEQQIHSLRPASAEVLGRLKADQPLRVLGFYSSLGDARQESQRQHFKQLMEAVDAASDAVEWELIDPDEQPFRARQEDVTTHATVFARIGDRSERLHDPDEGDLINATLRLLSDSHRQVLFSEGHGELDRRAVGKRGLSQLSRRLDELGFQTGSIELLREPIPADCALLVMLGPRAALQPVERDALRSYVKGGGSLMLGIAPEVDAGLSGLLADWGLSLGDDLVLDPLMRSVVGDSSVPVSAEFGFHEITRSLQVPLMLPTARSVGTVEQDPSRVATFVLASTSEAALGERDLDAAAAEQGPDDLSGPVPLVAVSELRDADGQRSGRVLLAGDSDWLSDAFASQAGNLDLAVSAAAFLTEREDLVDIPSAGRPSHPLELSFLQELVIILLAVVGIPGGTVVAGVGVWVWRRSL